MSIKRTALAHWEGSGAEGTGTLTTPMSRFMDNHPYSFKARFKNEDGSLGTNPEELIVAAHAGCYAMKLSFVLGGLGFTPEALDVKGTLHMNEGVIETIHLAVEAKVPGISDEQFLAATTDAKENCPVSKVLNAAISLEARLV
ncbi:MAG TPA: OsmC family peroxiredoxin [Rhodothermales bacterium]|nr:OsmC family peroxiredoxin [Rhodothermales bacterium]